MLIYYVKLYEKIKLSVRFLSEDFSPPLNFLSLQVAWPICNYGQVGDDKTFTIIMF